MNRQEIIARVRALSFPSNSYVVFGSAPLAMAGLREANDIDFLVSAELLEQLRAQGWTELDKGGQDKPLVHDVFEAHGSWNFSTYSPTLPQLLETADIIEGIPFASLAEVRKWKVASGRPKDLVDLQLMG